MKEKIMNLVSKVSDFLKASVDTVEKVLRDIIGLKEADYEPGVHIVAITIVGIFTVVVTMLSIMIIAPLIRIVFSLLLPILLIIGIVLVFIKLRKE